MPAKGPKQPSRLTPVSQLDRFRPPSTIGEAGGGGGGGGQRRGLSNVVSIAPGVKGPGWSYERLEQLMDHEVGLYKLNAVDP
jgi:hypothetical protein